MDRQTKRETNSPRGRRVASPAGPAGASLSPAATPVPAPSGRRRPEAPCFFPYVPPLLPNADRESPAALAGDAEQLQDLRLRSVAQNCRALASILRLEDWDEIAEALHADGEEGALSFGEFLAQYLATMGSISENCAWEAEDEISSASRWRTGARHNSATLLDPLMDLGQDEASPAQVARATLEAIADSPEDRHLARFLWEVIHRIVEEPVDGLGGRIAIASLFSVKAVIDMVQMLVAKGHFLAPNSC